MQFELAFERASAFEDRAILLGDPLAEFAAKDLIGGEPDQNFFAFMAGALGERPIDFGIAAEFALTKKIVSGTPSNRSSQTSGRSSAASRPSADPWTSPRRCLADRQAPAAFSAKTRRPADERVGSEHSFRSSGSRGIQMTANPFTGTIPALMTPCTPERKPDFDALVRKGRELVRRHVGRRLLRLDGRLAAADRRGAHDRRRTAGATGVPVIVGTGAQNTARAAALAATLKNCGAAGLMIIPRVLSRGVSAAAQRDHFDAVLSAASTCRR